MGLGQQCTPLAPWQHSQRPGVPPDQPVPPLAPLTTTPGLPRTPQQHQAPTCNWPPAQPREGATPLHPSTLGTRPCSGAPCPNSGALAIAPATIHPMSRSRRYPSPAPPRQKGSTRRERGGGGGRRGGLGPKSLFTRNGPVIFSRLKISFFATTVTLVFGGERGWGGGGCTAILIHPCPQPQVPLPLARTTTAHAPRTDTRPQAGPAGRMALDGGCTVTSRPFWNAPASHRTFHSHLRDLPLPPPSPGIPLSSLTSTGRSYEGYGAGHTMGPIPNQPPPPPPGPQLPPCPPLREQH